MESYKHLLRFAHSLPRGEIWEAHTQCKRRLIELVNRSTNAGFDECVLTIGFARRAAAYKRSLLLLSDPERLRKIVENAGRIQVVFGGKAHPDDRPGKEGIQRLVQLGHSLKPQVRIAFVETYDMELAKVITSGVDVWLNTPQPPLEASGTSGMKAALNGVPSLSILDGWWIEGCVEEETGWAIGGRNGTEIHPDEDRSAADAASLYDKLEHVVLPLFYNDRDHFIDVMRHSISRNGSFFHTQRMLQQYVLKAYLV